jgi:hypothetical protein
MLPETRPFGRFFCCIGFDRKWLVKDVLVDAGQEMAGALSVN